MITQTLGKTSFPAGGLLLACSRVRGGDFIGAANPYGYLTVAATVRTCFSMDARRSGGSKSLAWEVPPLFGGALVY
jgi:hypothetical protein